MSNRVASITYTTLAVIFFILDQSAKYFAFHYQSMHYYIVRPWLGWEYFANDGIAFGIPLPEPLVLVVTPIILLGVYLLWQKTIQKTSWLYAGTTLLVAGAFSNFIDRMLFSITIDYIRILYSVINIADIMIFVGALCLILHEKQIHPKEKQKES